MLRILAHNFRLHINRSSDGSLLLSLKGPAQFSQVNHHCGARCSLSLETVCNVLSMVLRLDARLFDECTCLCRCLVSRAAILAELLKTLILHQQLGWLRLLLQRGLGSDRGWFTNHNWPFSSLYLLCACCIRLQSVEIERLLLGPGSHETLVLAFLRRFVGELWRVNLAGLR